MLVNLDANDDIWLYKATSDAHPKLLAHTTTPRYTN
jgi:hypothetical protein